MGWATQADIYRKDDLEVMESRQPKINMIEPQTTPEGGTIWISTSKVPLQNADGEVFGVLGAYEDITARRQADENLRESEQKFRSVVQESMDGFALTDEQGVIIEWNPGMEHISGLLREQVIGKPQWDVQMLLTPLEKRTPESLEKFRAISEEALRTGGGSFLNHVLEVTYIREKDEQRTARQLVYSVKTLRGFCIATTAHDITDRRQMEQALRESEEKYRSVVNTLSEGILLQNKNGVILACNQAAENILELTKDPQSGRMSFSSLQIVHEDGSPAQDDLHPSMQAVKDGKPVRGVVMGIRSRVGKLKWISINSQPMWSDEGKPSAYIVSSFSDITEKKQAEEEAQKAEARYHALFEQSHDAVYLLDLQGRHILANKRAADMLGYTPDELAQLSVGETSAEVEQSANVLERLTRGENIPLYERLFRKKNGDLIPVEISVELVRDKKGQIMHIQSVVRDITERKHAEQQLRDSEMRYRIVAENTHDWSFWQSPEGKFLYSSPSCFHVTGRTADEFLRDAELFVRIIYPDDRVGWMTHLQEVNQKRARSEYEFRIITPDENIHWVSHVCQPIFDEQGVYLGTRGSNRDITFRKYAEIELAGANEQLRIHVREIEQLQAELREQALRDPLTDLYNRRYLNETMERDLARMKRERRPLSVIMLDIDHFKNINDSYGHAMGDQFLVAVSDLLKKQTRGSDIACRYGGEEFLLVLPGSTAKSAFNRAEEIRRQCANLRIHHGNTEVGITISAGVAAFPAHGKHVAELIEKADQAMYASKGNGRNKSMIWNKLHSHFLPLSR